MEQYVNNLFSSYKHEINESDIGIISPYKKQVPTWITYYEEKLGEKISFI